MEEEQLAVVARQIAATKQRKFGLMGACSLGQGQRQGRKKTERRTRSVETVTVLSEPERAGASPQ